jgi:hypothetical protein
VKNSQRGKFLNPLFYIAEIKRKGKMPPLVSKDARGYLRWEGMGWLEVCRERVYIEKHGRERS